jgi:hypothetical protein
MTEQRYPGFIKDHFFNEQIGSALGRRSPPDSDRVPLCILWLEHLVLLFPISLLFPAAVKAAFRSRKVGRPWFSNLGFLLLWWFLVVAIGISFANTQDYYLMIVWAPVAVWIAWTVTKSEISFKWPAIAVSLLGISGLLVGLVLAVSSRSESADFSMSRTLVGDTILNVFQVLPPTAWRGIIPLLFIASTSALVVGISAFIFNREGRSELCLAGFAFLMAGVFAIGTRAMQLVEDEFSSAKIAKMIDARDGSGGMVIAEGDPNEKTTLFFYLHRPIFWVDGHPNIEFATRTLGIGRDHYLKREQVAEAWRKTKQIFLVIEGDALSEWAAYLRLGPERSNPIGTCGSRVILANR